ncbi:MAG: hypothetical protein IJB73_06040 [Firmicutes bacterium]|nr:hypothetical protein [Bacillota bacterium]
MFVINDGEIEFRKDYKKKLVYALALLLALTIFLLILRVGAVTKFVEGSRTVYEGVVTDHAMTSIPLVSDNPFYEMNDTRGYICLELENGDEICIYSASGKAPDRRKYTFPDDLYVGSRVVVTAAEEVGTGLMVVQEKIYYIENQETADS